VYCSTRSIFTARENRTLDRRVGEFLPRPQSWASCSGGGGGGGGEGGGGGGEGGGGIQFFTGGEARPSARILAELIRTRRANDLYTKPITGGTLLDQEKLRHFREEGRPYSTEVQGATSEEPKKMPACDRIEKNSSRGLIRQCGFPLTSNVVSSSGENIVEVPETPQEFALAARRRSTRVGEYAVLACAAENRGAGPPAQLMPSREQ